MVKQKLLPRLTEIRENNPPPQETETRILISSPAEIEIIAIVITATAEEIIQVAIVTVAEAEAEIVPLVTVIVTGIIKVETVVQGIAAERQTVIAT
jgi:hypothetical protein